MGKVFLFDKTKRTKMGGFPVKVCFVKEDGSLEIAKELCPKRSQKVQNHSPDGFNWGYTGSGPAQCALGIMLEVTNDKRRSLNLYHKLVSDAISQIPEGELFEITEERILEWIKTEEEFWWRKYTVTMRTWETDRSSPKMSSVIHKVDGVVYANTPDGAKRQATILAKEDPGMLKTKYGKWSETGSVISSRFPGYKELGYYRRTKDIKFRGGKERYSWIAIHHYVKLEEGVIT